jgi:hypothetical protein
MERGKAWRVESACAAACARLPSFFMSVMCLTMSRFFLVPVRFVRVTEDDSYSSRLSEASRSLRSLLLRKC